MVCEVMLRPRVKTIQGTFELCMHYLHRRFASLTRTTIQGLSNPIDRWDIENSREAPLHHLEYPGRSDNLRRTQLF